MNFNLTQQQIQSYQENGFLLVENFLNEMELAFWRESVTQAIHERGGKKCQEAMQRLAKTMV